MSYNNFPYIDTFNIAFASSNIDNSSTYVGLGSVLYLDDIGIVYNPLSTGTEYTHATHSVFPNPFSDVAVFTFDNINNENHELVIYDILGNEVIKKENITTNSVMLQRNNLLPGIYQYRITENKNGRISAIGKLVID